MEKYIFFYLRKHTYAAPLKNTYKYNIKTNIHRLIYTHKMDLSKQIMENFRYSLLKKKKSSNSTTPQTTLITFCILYAYVLYQAPAIVLKSYSLVSSVLLLKLFTPPQLQKINRRFSVAIYLLFSVSGVYCDKQPRQGPEVCCFLYSFVFPCILLAASTQLGLIYTPGFINFFYEGEMLCSSRSSRPFTARW